MFIGNLFYKDKTGEIKELSARILSKKITSLAQGRDFSQEELEHIVSVISFYLHNSPEHTLIEETDIERLVGQLYGTGTKGLVTVEGIVFDDTVWQAMLRELQIELPTSIARRFYDEFASILVYLSEQHGLSDISRTTVVSVLRDLCKKYTIDYTPPHALSFPMQEVLLLYAKYPPSAIGKLLSPVFNRYVYEHFMLTEHIKKYIASSVLTPYDIEPFRVDELDCGQEDAGDYSISTELVLFTSASEFPVCAYHYSQHIAESGMLIVSGENEFIPWQEGYYGITYNAQSAALFDDSNLPVYSSLFNAQLSLSQLRTTEDIPGFVKAIMKFYNRYSEYFYLIEKLKGRTLYIKLHLTITNDEDYATAVQLHNELPEFILLVQHITDRDVPILFGKGTLRYAYCPIGEWNEERHEWCKRSNIYMLQCVKEDK